MKKVAKIGIIVFISMLYCAAIGVVNYSFYNSETTSSKKVNTEKGSYLSEVIGSPFSYALQSESSVNAPNAASSTFKNSFQGLFLLASASKQPDALVFTQYFYYAKNLLIRFRKADLIFPFHYFW